MTVRTQTRYPTTVVSDDAVGTLAWTTPEEAEAQDGVYAEAENPGSDVAQSERLKFTDFGFDCPSNATVLGRKRTIRRKVALGGVSHVATSNSVSVSVSGTGATVTLSIPKQVGTKKGDVLVAAVAARKSEESGYTPAIAPAPDWTFQVASTHSITGGTDRRYRTSLFTYVALEDYDAEPATYDFEVSVPSALEGNLAAIGMASVFRGGRIGEVASQWTSSSGTNITAASVTTVADNAMLVGAYWALYVGDTSFTAPSGLTERREGFSGPPSNDMNLMICDGVQATAGASGSKSGTVSDSSTRTHGILMVIEPSQATDEECYLVLADGSLGTENKALAGEWSTDDTDAEYGAADDLWSSEVGNPADVNDADSGGALSVNVPPGATVKVDLVEDEVTYNCFLTITPTTTTIDSPGDTLEATFAFDGGACVLNNTRWRIYADAAGTQLVYDSGSVVSSATSHVIGSGTPTLAWAAPLGDTTYYLRVTGTEDGTADPDGVGDPISGDSGLVSFITDWTLPTAPTGLAAVAVTEAP